MSVRILIGDCRTELAKLQYKSVHCCVTSPPYFGLRDYGHAGQIGLESTPDAFVAEMVAVFREVRRVLRDDGTLWLNLGDSYATTGCGTADASSSTLGGSTTRQTSFRGSSAGRRDRRYGLKQKDLIGIPWRVAFALQADGWYLRQDIIWSKPNPMPESVTDRCTKAHEYIFLMSKSARYFYDQDAVRQPGITTIEEAQSKWATRRDGQGKGQQEGIYHSYKDVKPFQNDPNPLGVNRRSVWTVSTQPYSEAHFATFPPALIEPCIKAGCPVGGTVLDPFGGAGTTGLVADRLQRSSVLIELNPEYAAMAERRIHNDAPLFAEAAE